MDLLAALGIFIDLHYRKRVENKWFVDCGETIRVLSVTCF